MILEILIVVALTVLNGFFAMSETAMVSSRRAHLRERTDRGGSGARAALELVEDPNRFLSTVQIGISLIGVLAGAFGGAAIAGPLAETLRGAPVVGPYAQTLAFALVVGSITYLSLIIGELVPKRLALGAPEAVAAFVARPMRLLANLAAPVVWFLGASTDFVLRLLRVKPSAEAPVSEQEVEILLEEGARAGVFEDEERDLARRALRLDDTPVRELMTPRPAVVWLDADDSSQEHLRRIVESRHSWFPVARGDLDGLLGIVSAKDAWARDVLAGADDRADLLGSLKRPPVVPEGAPATRALEAFQSSGLPIAVVADERGNVEGLVTPTDVLVALVGAAHDPGAGTPMVVTREDGSLFVDGLLSADELKERLGFDRLPRDEEDDYQTVGGLMMAGLERVPAAGDAFDWEGWRLEVADMDGNRVDKVLATPTKDGEAAEG